MGVVEGVFESMWPHPVTGRAEYFGSIVRGARVVASEAPPGSVYLGREAVDKYNTSMEGIFMQPVSNGFLLDYLGRVPLTTEEGTSYDTTTSSSQEIPVFKCHACDSWYDKVLENRRISRGY